MKAYAVLVDGFAFRIALLFKTEREAAAMVREETVTDLAEQFENPEVQEKYFTSYADTDDIHYMSVGWVDVASGDPESDKFWAAVALSPEGHEMPFMFAQTEEALREKVRVDVRQDPRTGEYLPNNMTLNDLPTDWDYENMWTDISFVEVAYGSPIAGWGAPRLEQD